MLQDAFECAGEKQRSYSITGRAPTAAPVTSMDSAPVTIQQPGRAGFACLECAIQQRALSGKVLLALDSGGCCRPR